jgi:hypothetical protein
VSRFSRIFCFQRLGSRNICQHTYITRRSRNPISPYLRRVRRISPRYTFHETVPFYNSTGKTTSGMKNQFTTSLSSCVPNVSPAPGSSPHPTCGESQKICDSKTTLTTPHSTGTPIVPLSSKKNYATTTLTPTLPPSLNSSNPNAIDPLLAPTLLLNAQSPLTTLLLPIPLYLIHTTKSSPKPLTTPSLTALTPTNSTQLKAHPSTNTTITTSEYEYM